jgi:hypothetical protein
MCIVNIIAYTWSAAIHCPNCTREAAANGTLTRQPPLHRDTDEHGLAIDLVDSQGNDVGVMFDTDEVLGDIPLCDDCGEEVTA